MVKMNVIGYQRLNSSAGEFYKIYCVSDAVNEKGVGYIAYEGFVDKRHLDKNNVSVDNLIGRSCSLYNVKDGDKWKTGITFK